MKVFPDGNIYFAQVIGVVLLVWRPSDPRVEIRFWSCESHAQVTGQFSPNLFPISYNHNSGTLTISPRCPGSQLVNTRSPNNLQVNLNRYFAHIIVGKARFYTENNVVSETTVEIITSYNSLHC